MSHRDPTSDAASPGTRVIGAYEVLCAVGDKEGMWAVRARASEGASTRVARLRQVALLELVRTEGEVAPVLDQARVVARIEHPNVGRVLDVADGDIAYVVMEWLEGASLERIARAAAPGSRLPVPWVLAVIADVLAGLHAAHEVVYFAGTLHPPGLVHREVSPENVRVTFDGRVKVVGFAAAGARRGQAVTRVLGSRPPYFAPEQVAGEEIDRRADVFSAGALLYLLLTGVHPFEPEPPTGGGPRAAPSVETMRRISQHTVAPPSTLVPGLSSDLDAIVLEALAKDPKARFQTAAALQRAIESLDAARPRPTDQEIGAVVRDRFPGEAEERASKLARAVQAADAVAETRSAPPPAATTPRPERRPAPPLPTAKATARPQPRLVSTGELAFGVGAVVLVGAVALFSTPPPRAGRDAASAAPSASVEAPPRAAPRKSVAPR